MPSSGTERVTLFKDRLPNSGTDWVIDESEVVSSSENEEQPIKDSTVRINTSLPPRRTWINKKAQFIFRVGNDTMNEDDAEAMLGRDFPFVAAALGRAGPPKEQEACARSRSPARDLQERRWKLGLFIRRNFSEIPDLKPTR